MILGVRDFDLMFGSRFVASPRLPHLKIETAITGFVFGFDLGIITSTLAQPFFQAHFGGSISDSESGGIVSSITGGATAAVFWIGDWLGRRWTIFTGSVVSVFGCALQAGTTTIAMMIAGRFIASLSLGILTSTIPCFVPRSRRGPIVVQCPGCSSGC